ncbi:hypothetical protein [Nocardia sp. IFM 10818]
MPTGSELFGGRQQAQVRGGVQTLFAREAMNFGDLLDRDGVYQRL